MLVLANTGFFVGPQNKTKFVEVFQAKVGGKFAALCVLESDVDIHAKEALLSTAEDVLRIQKKNIQPWVSYEVLDLCDQRQQLKVKQQTYTGTEAGLEYRKVNGKVRKKMKAAKEELIEEQCKNIEGNDVGKQQSGLQQPRGFHQDPAA